MQTSIWENIADTPWWFFLAVLGLIWMAWLATKPKTVAVKSLFLIPVIYIPLSLASIFLSFPITPASVFIWIGATMAGTVLGWLHFRVLRIKAIQNESRLYIPGTWTLFILLLLIAVSKYYYGYSFIIDPQYFIQAKYATIIVALYGLFAGLFIGKVIYSLRCVKYGPYLSNA